MSSSIDEKITRLKKALDESDLYHSKSTLKSQLEGKLHYAYKKEGGFFKAKVQITMK